MKLLQESKFRVSKETSLKETLFVEKYSMKSRLSKDNSELRELSTKKATVFSIINILSLSLLNTNDKNKHIMENLQSKYELIGNSIDEVLDAVNALKFHYDKDCVIVEDESGHDSGNKIGGYITFDDSIKLRSGGVDPKSNIVREMNYILEEEMKNVKLYKVDTY